MVVRFDPTGRVKMVFGRKPEASDEGAHPLEHPRPPLPPIDGQFRQVTDVAWDSADNIYISDGYINSRVAKYDKDGNWAGSFGEPGTGRGSTARCTPIVIDHQDHIYIADRDDAGIQVTDTSGEVLKIVHDGPPPAGTPPLRDRRPAGARRSADPAAAGLAVGHLHQHQGHAAGSCCTWTRFPGAHGQSCGCSTAGSVLSWRHSARHAGEFGWMGASFGFRTTVVAEL